MKKSFESRLEALEDHFGKPNEPDLLPCLVFPVPVDSVEAWDRLYASQAPFTELATGSPAEYAAVLKATRKARSRIKWHGLFRAGWKECPGPRDEEPLK